MRKSAPGTAGGRFASGTQGGVRASNVTVLGLLTTAWDVPDFRVAGGPRWTTTEQFDISFTADRPVTIAEPDANSGPRQADRDCQRRRMQAVLRDRFGLRLRTETRQLPIYRLTVAKGGSKLKPPTKGSGLPGVSTDFSRGELTGIDVSMASLARVLADLVQRPVIDATGIQNEFDFKVQWTPADEGGPSLFTALTEQLGLRLEPKKGPVTVYIIERVHRPTEN